MFKNTGQEAVSTDSIRLKYFHEGISKPLQVTLAFVLCVLFSALELPPSSLKEGQDGVCGAHRQTLPIYGSGLGRGRGSSDVTFRPFSPSFHPAPSLFSSPVPPLRRFFNCLIFSFFFSFPPLAPLGLSNSFSRLSSPLKFSSSHYF